MKYGQAPLKKSAVFKWHKKFKGQEAVKDDARSGRPKTHRTCENGKISLLMRSDRRLSARVIAEELIHLTVKFRKEKIFWKDIIFHTI